MPYIVLSDVRSVAPQLFKQSAPNDADVNNAIRDVDNIINAQLARLGYTVPVTSASPQGLAIVQDIEKHGVIARLINQRAFGVADPRAWGGDIADAKFNGALKALADPNNPFDLPDVPKATANDVTETYASSAIGGNTVNDPVAMADIFDRDTMF